MNAVIYCRVSSWSQAPMSGLARQFDTCTAFASENGYQIHACFSEVGSGEGDMPIREQAIRVARSCGADLLVESTDRWSRKCCKEPDGVRVIQCDPGAREFAGTLRTLVLAAKSGGAA